jgi:class 3 adenylate cyclase
LDVVQCAVEVQDTIGKENANRIAGEQMRFRIGVHVGDIIRKGTGSGGVKIAVR